MEFETIELTKDVLIFKNVLKDKKRVRKFLTQAREEGYVDPLFKTWITYKPQIYYYKFDPNNANDDSYKTSNEYSAQFMRECQDIFFKCLKIYKENYFNKEYFKKYNWKESIPTSLEEFNDGISKEEEEFEWIMGDFLILENENTPSNKKMSMGYHTDRKVHPYSANVIFNFNIYMNDDYEGGAIRFIDMDNAEKELYINKDGVPVEYYIVDKIYEYKMESGDAMLFRTDHFHSVERVDGHKWYARQFLVDPKPTQEWFDKRDELGGGEEFKKFLEEYDKEHDKTKFRPEIIESLDELDTDKKYIEGKETPVIIRKK